MQGALLPLMVWLSPAFPVGGFAYSHGLEWAFETGDLTEAEGLADWLGALVEHGALRNDLILFAASWRASGEADAKALRDVAELALALANSAERRLETVTQGNAFVAALAGRLALRVPSSALQAPPGRATSPIPSPSRVAASAGHALPLAASLEAYRARLRRQSRLGRRPARHRRPDRRPARSSPA
jgi:urease accessory protein